MKHRASFRLYFFVALSIMAILPFEILAEGAASEHAIMLEPLSIRAWRQIVDSDGYYQGRVARVENLLSPGEPESENFVSDGLAVVGITTTTGSEQDFFISYADDSAFGNLRAWVGTRIGVLFRVINGKGYIIGKPSPGKNFFEENVGAPDIWLCVRDEVQRSAGLFCATDTGTKSRFAKRILSDLMAMDDMQPWIEKAPQWKAVDRQSFAGLLCAPNIETDMTSNTPSKGSNPGLFYVANSMHEFVVILLTTSFDYGFRYDIDRYSMDADYKKRIDSIIEYSEYLHAGKAD